jgi:protein ImuA
MLGLPPDLAALRRQMARLERPCGEGVALGAPALDAALPPGGLPRCGLHDILGADGDAAATGFALALAGRLAGGRGRLLLVGLRRRGGEAGLPYGPGLLRFGIDPERLIVAAAVRPADLLWAMEEGLRSGALAAVIGEGVAADATASRRLQLAAEAGGAAAVLLPPADARSPVTLSRWRIAAAAGGLERPRWRVVLERCRGGSPGDWLMEWDDAARRFAVVPVLADRRPALATA